MEDNMFGTMRANILNQGNCTEAKRRVHWKNKRLKCITWSLHPKLESGWLRKRCAWTGGKHYLMQDEMVSTWVQVTTTLSVKACIESF